MDSPQDVTPALQEKKPACHFNPGSIENIDTLPKPLLSDATIEKTGPAILPLSTESSEELDNQSEEPPSLSPELPPKDRGRGAITALVACILIDATILAVLLSYGVFQEHYTQHFPNHSKASWIGVLSNGVLYLGAPVVTYCSQEFAVPKKVYICIGCAICSLSLLVSAFISDISGLIIVQGLCYGLGAVLLESPLFITLNTWFEKRRGLAYGLLFGSADLLGAAFTFLSTKLLQTYGLRITFLIYFAIILACVGPAIFILHERPRTPGPINRFRNPERARLKAQLRTDSETSQDSLLDGHADTEVSVEIPTTVLPYPPCTSLGESCPVEQLPSKRYYRRGVFYLFMLSNLLQACAIYLPFIYLPAFATQSGHSKSTAATILAVANIGMLVGDLSFGKLSDRFHVSVLILVSSGVSAIVTFFLWGLSGTKATPHSQALLISFAFVFGAFGGGYIVLWPRMGTLFGGRDAAMVYATLSLGRGVGNVISGPISQVLLKVGTVPLLAAGQYGSLLVFVGVCMSTSAIIGPAAIAALWWEGGEVFDPILNRSLPEPFA